LTERNCFQDKIDLIEEFFKENVENLLEEERIREDPKRREEFNRIYIKVVRELKFEMDHYEWKLIK
jgi:hypothetical protein